MAVPVMDRPSGPSSTASLKRMLDLEQKYKMARISSDQTAPTSSPMSEAFLALEPQPKQPLQARRRNPKEQPVQSRGDLTLQSSRRNHPGPPLSIVIPSPTSPDTDRPVETGAVTPRVGKNGEATPGREKTVTFFEAGEDDDEDLDEDEDDDRKSVQSSICHSPSWENYGQKKKDKKAKAEKKRQEKAKADQELKSAKKRLANRLAKMPPTSASATASSTSVATAPASAVAHGKLSRGPSAPLIRLGSQNNSSSSQAAKSEKPASQKTGSSWGFASFASGLVASAANPFPAHVTKAIAAAKEQPQANAQVHVGQETRQQPRGNINSRKASKPDSQTELRPSTGHGTSSKAQLQKAPTIATSEQDLRETAPVSKNARAMTMPEPISNGISYPPRASRTHVLRQAPGSSHARVNSTTVMTDEPTKFSKAQNMRSSQNSKLYGAGNTSEESLQASVTANDRGRQRSNSSNSYVRRSRDQSTERSLAGLNDEIVVPETCALQQPSKRSNPRRLTAFLKHKAGGEGKAVLLAADSHPSSDAAENQDDSTDYFTFVNGAYYPPSLELTSPAPGLLSSLRSMMSRRSSASSGQGMQLPVSAHNSSHVTAKPPPEHGGPRSAPPARIPLSATSVDHIPEAVVLPPKAAQVLGEYHPTPIGSQAPPPGSRPSEGSSMSSYNEGSSVPPSPASTPDTSRPQSTKGARSSVDDNQIGPLDISVPRDHDTVTLATTRRPAVSRDGTTINDSLSNIKAGREPHSLQRLERPPSRGRILDDLERPPSRGRLLELGRRPLSKSRAYEDLRPMASSEETLPLPDDDRWSRTAMPIDIDAQSFVTTLMNLDDIDVTLPLAVDDKTTRWGRLDGDSRPGSSHSQMDGGIIGFDAKDRERARSSDSRRRDTLPAQAKNMPFEQEDPRPISQHANIARINGDYRGHLIANTTKGEASFLPPVTQQIVIPPKSKARMSAPLSAPLPMQTVTEPHLTSTQSQASSSSSNSSTSSAAYLHEARRSTPLVPSLLSNTHRPKAMNPPAPTAVTGPRPALKGTSTAPASVPRQQSLLKAVTTTTTTTTTNRIASANAFHASAPDLPSQSHMLNPNDGQTGKPVAKMLVECCSCKFFLDMPSRVYECMAQPDAVVTDRTLGVSGAITTMVKCPWCAHNMSTKCCAGYAAVVYLKERMH